LGAASRIDEHRPMPSTQSAPPLRIEHVSAARRFFGDVMIALRVLNEARHRAVAAVFGVERGWRSNLVTAIAIGALVDATQRVAATPRTQVRKMRSGTDAVGDSMIATAVLKETLDRVAGPRPEAMASGAALIVFAVVANSIRPTIEKSLHAIRAAVRGVITGVRRARDAIIRYGG
jgi:hypothetical protein